MIMLVAAVSAAVHIVIKTPRRAAVMEVQRGMLLLLGAGRGWTPLRGTAANAAAPPFTAMGGMAL